MAGSGGGCKGDYGKPKCPSCAQNYIEDLDGKCVVCGYTLRQLIWKSDGVQK